MLSTRRGSTARHEFRFGTREIVVFCGAFLIVCGLTFALGVLVGRELGSPRGGAGKPLGAASASETRAAKPAAASEERLTFYQSLTAPTADLPSVTAPKVEERLVAAEPSTPKAPAKSERRPLAAGTQPAPERGGRATGGGGPRDPASPATVAAAGDRTLEPQLWTVQVSSFRSRALAEELRARLAARGFDAYLVSMSSEEGRVRHRVRVGAFATRAEAERVASELRSERSLNPFVTTRTR
jgi:cell division septation protein DedD